MKPDSTRLAAAGLLLCLIGCGHGHEDHVRHEPGHGRHASEPGLKIMFPASIIRLRSRFSPSVT